jgi:hypothetical protein
MKCPKCRYPLAVGASCCPECGLPTRGRPERFDGDHDLKRLLGRLWRITGWVCLPNLVLAALFWLHGPGLPGWMGAETLAPLAFAELVLFGVHWAKMSTIVELTDEGSEQHGGSRRWWVCMNARIGQVCFVVSILVWGCVVAVRSGV